jgi:integrase
MGIGKQAKVLTSTQVKSISQFLRIGRNGIRNQAIFLLSVRAGLRSKEIAELRWLYLLDSDGQLGDTISLPNCASKGSSGREIPIHRELKVVLSELMAMRKGQDHEDFVVLSERQGGMSAQVIVNFFYTLYRKLGLVGASSHSGRRTFITEVSRKISMVGGSMRDVQMLAGHSSLQTTQRYIEGCTESKRKVVDLL